MRTTSLQSLTLTICISLFGCSGADGGDDLGVGGLAGIGGGPGNGGSPSVGGNTQGKGGATGGSQSSSGGSGVGGNQSTGGTKATGGAGQTGGATATGGSNVGGQPATGGKAAGGASQTGGSVSTGGAVSTGGKATGGAATGGAATGGKATGGTATGGAATGGAATGGKATGGAATGGAATGGSAGALPKFVGNITTGNSVNPSGLNYAKYWNQITPENQGKWGSVQSTPSSAFNWASLDSIYSYSQTNNIIFKQHTFVWGAQQPSGTPTLAQVENWIKSFCQRYPNTKLIDVVNEPPPHTTPTYTANLGAGEGGSWPWITKAFKLARQYCGNAILILNDYNNIEYADQEQHFINIVKDIKANGAPIDAVGCQAHGLKGRSTATVQANVNTMASGTGLPVYITEYDIGDASDAVQLTNFQNHFSVFLNTASVKGITVWGWINGSTWISNSGIVNGTAPRSSMTWLMGQLGRPVPPN